MRTLAIAAVIATLVSAACTDSTRSPVEPRSTASDLPPSSNLLGQLGSQFVQISAGDFHTCALRLNGAFYCWGGDDVGQVGIAPTGTCDLVVGTGEPCVPEPTRITGSGVVRGIPIPLDIASTVSAGGSHTCVVSFARAWCWGANNVGQTGVAGGGAVVATPTPASTSTAFLTLDAGGSVTCALSLASSLYCWGERYSNTSLGTTPTFYAQIPGYGIRVSVAQTNGCVQSLTGVWRCFGDNQRGELATDPAILQESVPLIATALTATAKHITTSNFYMCADLANGTVSCVGNNADLQLGGSPVSGPGSISYTTVVVGGGMRLHGAAAGGNHVCAIDDDSHAWCWGENTNAELGNGGGANTDVPQAVLGGIRFRALAAGGSHTCGIAVDNTIYCWGANRHGQLGDPAYVLSRAFAPQPTAPPKG